MAEELKRVGLVFTADGAVDFKKSLNEVNASIQENRSAFKLAQSQWDDNTKSVDKLRDRQKYLAEQTKDYTDKCKLLQAQLDELENAENRDEQAIQKKKNQLNTAKTSLNNYQKGLEEVTDELKKGTAQIEDYVKKLDSIGSKATSAGKKLSVVSAGVVAVGGAAVAAAMELDEGYDTIITKTGATGEALQGLNDVADEVFSDMAVEMSDVGIAIGEVNTRFASTGDELRDLSELFIQFSEINGTDLNSSIDTVDKIMTQYNIDISQTGNVLGILTKRSQETGIATDQLMNLVSDNSATFKELGFSVTDSINLLSQFETNGVDASTAIAGLRKSVINMAAEGLSADEALKSIIESIKNAKTETEAINIASETFGTKGAVEMTNSIREGRFSLDELSDSLNKYSDTVTSTYEETLDPWDQMTASTNKLKVAGSDLAGEMFEVLAPMIDSLSLAIEDLTEWFSGLDEGEKQNIVTIGLIVAAIGPLLMVFGSMATGIGNIITIVSKIPTLLSTVGTGAKALWGILSANPIGAIFALIMSLIAIFTTLYQKCEWFRNGVDRIWGDIKEHVSGLVGWLKGIFNFEWKLPKIKMPHFKASGKFSLNPLSVPKISVDWYAKGGILNSPTIFGSSGDTLLGGGEAGPEAVLPIDLLRRYIREENSANNVLLAEMIKEAISELNITAENNIYIGDKKLASVVTDMVIKKLSENMKDMRLAKGAV